MGSIHEMEGSLIQVARDPAEPETLTPLLILQRMTSLSCKIDTAHRDVIHDAQLNYYGNRLATCSSDRMIKIFEVKPNGQTFPIAELSGHVGPVWQLSWAHPRFEGMLASCGYDKKVIIWKETNGRWQKSHEWSGHEASVNSVAFAPHQFGLMLASASADTNIGILTYNLPRNQWDSNQIIKAHDQGVNAISWAPAVLSDIGSSAEDQLPRRLASCGNDKLLKIWIEVEGSWKLERSLPAHTDFVRDVAWCPVVHDTTHTIISCGQDRNVFIWRCSDISSGEWTCKLLEKANGAVWHVSWSLCGTMLSVSSEDNKISLWKENLQGQWVKIEDQPTSRN